MIGEELPVEDLPMAAPELAFAMSNVLAGRLVYVLGGRGKTPLLRALALSLYRAGLNPLYIKLEWIKYNWGINEYINKYYNEHFKLTGYPATRDYDVVIVDDGELLAQYPKVYSRLLQEAGPRIKAVAVRTELYESIKQILGEGIAIRIGQEGGGRPKLPLGLTSIGRSVEIEII